MKTLYTFLFLFLGLQLLVAQPKWEVGGFIGISNYQGDINKHSIPELGESQLALGVVGRRNLNYIWSVRGNLNYGRLSGSDFNFFDRKGRGITFKTPMIELSVLGEWEPMGATRYRSGKSRFQKLVSPYLGTGLGVVYINPKTNYNHNEEDSLSDLKKADDAASYSKLQFIIPVTAGLKIDLNEEWVLQAELGFRYPFTDYLDGVSQAGNPNKNDWYLFGGFAATYRFRRKI